MSKLAIVTTEYLRDFTKKSLTDIGIPLDYELYLYSSFSDIVSVYEDIPHDIRGIITSGRFAAETIRKAHPDSSRVITSYDADDAGMYWLLLQLRRSPQFSPSRVYIDFFDVMGIELEEYMYSPSRVTLHDMLTSYMRGMTLERLLKVEEFCVNRHMQLWQQGKTDISVTRFSSIAQYLEDSGLPVRFAYPSLHHIKETCVQALTDVQIKMLQQNLLAVIEITVAAGDSEEEVHEWTNNLAVALNNFKKTNVYDFMLMPIPHGFEILTSRKAVIQLTNNSKGCRLQGYLRQNLDAPACIGYGIGNNIYQARVNAIAANREARLYKSGGSCLINEKDDLIPRLEDISSVVVRRGTHPSLHQASKKSGLSPMTIQKIIAVAREMENHRVTSQDVANKLGITRRSANRFLSALAKTKTAKIVSEKNSTTKGRPERVYQILTNIPRQQDN